MNDGYKEVKRVLDEQEQSRIDRSVENLFEARDEVKKRTVEPIKVKLKEKPQTKRTRAKRGKAFLAALTFSAGLVVGGITTYKGRHFIEQTTLDVSLYFYEQQFLDQAVGIALDRGVYKFEVDGELVIDFSNPHNYENIKKYYDSLDEFIQTKSEGKLSYYQMLLDNYELREKRGVEIPEDSLPIEMLEEFMKDNTHDMGGK